MLTYVILGLNLFRKAVTKIKIKQKEIKSSKKCLPYWTSNTTTCNMCGLHNSCS